VLVAGDEGGGSVSRRWRMRRRGGCGSAERGGGGAECVVQAAGGCGGMRRPKHPAMEFGWDAFFCRTAHLSPQQLNEFIDT
jgi:hypothetical protein